MNSRLAVHLGLGCFVALTLAVILSGLAALVSVRLLQHNSLPVAVVLITVLAAAVGASLVLPHGRRPALAPWTGKVTETDLVLVPGNFGPNDRAARTFLASLSRLSPAHWDAVRRIDRAEYESAVGMLARGRRETKAMRALNQLASSQPRAPAEAALGSALDQIARNLSRTDVAPVLSEAGRALIYEDLLSPEDFRALYGPMEYVLPGSTLKSRT